MREEMRFAVVGAGGFARFAVAQFIQNEGARLAGVYDCDAAAAALVQALAPGVRAYDTLAALLADPSIGLVYIGSPPHLHHAQSLAALQAGKHVICEKPAALQLAQAQQLKALAAHKQLLFVVNLMQRYNPLYTAVKALIDSQVLGAFLHGFFENYASDEALPADHWFWDQQQSGGIFIEHGVHFFDMFAGWFGPGKLVAAQKLARPGFADVWDIAQCTVTYAGNAPVHFFHGFNQPKILDRQELRLQFERGELTLFDWVPTRLVLNAICLPEDIATLTTLFPGAVIASSAPAATPQLARGRFKPIAYDRKIHLDTGQPQAKSQLYESLVRRMFDDQLKAIAEPGWRAAIDAANAVDSVALAAQAEEMAVWIA